MVREAVDTQKQNFWKEMIDKEVYIRLAWQEKYCKEFASDSVRRIQRKKRPDLVPKPVIPLKLPSIEKSKRSDDKAKKEVEAKARIAMLAKRDPGALLVEMRPASTRTKMILYKGFSQIGEGRYAYLQKRNQKNPEEKFEFPITSSWEYGWRLGDTITIDDMKTPKHGRTRIVKDSFYRPNGISF